MKRYNLIAICGEYTNQKGEKKYSYRQVGNIIEREDGNLNVYIDRFINLDALDQQNAYQVRLRAFADEKRDSSLSDHYMNEELPF